MSVPTVKLNNGTSMPILGFGQGTSLYNSECTAHTLAALKTGYTYLDMAQMYGNSQHVGAAIKQWGGKREDIYRLTKFGKDSEHDKPSDPRGALLAELKALGVEYVDTFLIHSPLMTGTTPLSETWKAMESLVEEGLTKSIGVSNFREEDLLKLKQTWKIAPVVNQIEFHPYVFHADNMRRMTTLCHDEGILIQSYGPLTPIVRASGGPIDPVIKKIAEEKKATEAQVLLRWATDYTGGIVVTTSRDETRRKEQLEALSRVEKLTDGQVEEIAEAGKGKFYRHFMKNVWDNAKP